MHGTPDDLRHSVLHHLGITGFNRAIPEPSACSSQSHNIEVRVRLDLMFMTVNRDLKNQLFSQVEILGKEQSLLPFSDTSIDATIQQLEDTNPISKPLLPDNLSSLVGDWQLVYASNGTVMTRPIAEVTNFLGLGIKVNKIWQSLTVENSQIMAVNQALIELSLLGEYKLSAEGIWQPEPDLQAAKVTFNAFTTQATKFLGRSDWTLPELKIPLLDFLRNEALWITSYLDKNTRIGRGATGNLFVFCR